MALFQQGCVFGTTVLVMSALPNCGLSEQTSLTFSTPSVWTKTIPTSAQLATSGLELLGVATPAGNPMTVVTFWKDTGSLDYAGEKLSERVFRCFDEIGEEASTEYCEVAYRDD